MFCLAPFFYSMTTHSSVLCVNNSMYSRRMMCRRWDEFSRGVATWLTISNLDIAVNSQEVSGWGSPYPWGTCKFHRKAIFHSPSGVPPGHYGHSDMTYDAISCTYVISWLNLLGRPIFLKGKVCIFLISVSTSYTECLILLTFSFL